MLLLQHAAGLAESTCRWVKTNGIGAGLVWFEENQQEKPPKSWGTPILGQNKWDPILVGSWGCDLGFDPWPNCRWVFFGLWFPFKNSPNSSKILLVSLLEIVLTEEAIHVCFSKIGDEPLQEPQTWPEG